MYGILKRKLQSLKDLEVALKSGGYSLPYSLVHGSDCQCYDCLTMVRAAESHVATLDRFYGDFLLKNVEPRDLLPYLATAGLSESEIEKNIGKGVYNRLGELSPPI